MAMQGNPTMQGLLANWYDKGIGVKQDPVKACVWISLAVLNGNNNFFQKLKKHSMCITTLSLKQAKQADLLIQRYQNSTNKEE